MNRSSSKGITLDDNLMCVCVCL